MADKTCPQCGEAVAETKAFCPSCGHAFVEEEKRTDASAYDKADHTMQMGQTMYNNMLSDMGLNVKKPEPERRVEVLKPATGTVQVLQPITPAASPAAPVQSTITNEPEKKSNSKIWLVTALVAVGLLLILIVAIVLVGLYLYFRAGRL